jgi:hypothetical protein
LALRPKVGEALRAAASGEDIDYDGASAPSSSTTMAMSSSAPSTFGVDAATGSSPKTYKVDDGQTIERYPRRSITGIRRHAAGRRAAHRPGLERARQLIA